MAVSSLDENIVKEAKVLYVEKANKMAEYESHIAQTVESQLVGDPALQILRLMPNNTPDFMHIPLDFLGFCLFTIVENNGLLMPGKPNLGVFKFKDRYCVFSDEKAVEKFLIDPEEYMKRAKEVCRQNPELIHLLKLQEEFPDASLAALLQGKDGMHPLFSISALMVNKDIQTPDHFLEKHIEPNYHWNEWDLRQKAL